MVNEMKEEEQIQPNLTPVFTDEILALLEADHHQAALSLVPAIQLLIDLRMLTVFCPDARQIVYDQPTGELTFHAEPREATINGNVQINCE